MKSTYKLVVLVMFATPYTMMHAMEEQPSAKASSSEQTLSIHDRLQQQKLQCLDLYITHQNNVINNASTMMGMLTKFIQQATDSSRCDSPDLIIENLQPMNFSAETNYKLTTSYAEAILKIQEIQLNEAKLENLKKTDSDKA